MNEEILKDSEKKISKFAIEKNEAKIFNSDSILVVGIGATAGKTSYLSNESSFNQQITGFHSKYHNNKYYFYLFKCTTDVFLLLANYTTLPILNNEFFKVVLIPVPPLSEQAPIAIHLESLTTKTDESIRLKEQQIEQLKQYKTSLINDVVTGKVRVA